MLCATQMKLSRGHPRESFVILLHEAQCLSDIFGDGVWFHGDVGHDVTLVLDIGARERCAAHTLTDAHVSASLLMIVRLLFHAVCAIAQRFLF